MPGLEITTNLAKSQIPSDFLTKASKKVAELTAKPESVGDFTLYFDLISIVIYFYFQYVQVAVLTDQLVSFAGTDEPSANVRLMSIGNISGPKTAPLVSALTDFITSELKIPKNRLVFFDRFLKRTSLKLFRYYITIVDMDPRLLAFNGATFA